MVLIQRPRDDALLVSECWCLSKRTHAGQLLHGRLGGHVEVREYALDTIHREFQEEVEQALTTVQLAGVLETIFG